jgi:hypothetical protein
MNQPVAHEPRRNLRQTITARVSDTEYSLIRIAAEQRSRAEGKRITPSGLVRKIVVQELIGGTRRVSGAAVELQEQG